MQAEKQRVQGRGMDYLDLNDVCPLGEPEGEKPHHKINAIEITDGFLDGCRLDFADGLNCIIGGRGTGKTTILEFIRYILDQMPDSFDSRPRSKVIDSIVRSNLGSGTIHLDVETKHGTRYRAERPWDDSVQVLDKDGDPVSVSLDRDLVFKTDIYSQNEIEEIATNPKFQLSLIDKFEEEAIRQASQEIQKGKHAIDASAAELRNLDERIRATEGVVPEIDVIAKRLAEMQVVAGPEADMINAVHAHKALRGRETEALKELRKFADTAGDEFQNIALAQENGAMRPNTETMIHDHKLQDPLKDFLEVKARHGQMQDRGDHPIVEGDLTKSLCLFLAPGDVPDAPPCARHHPVLFEQKRRPIRREERSVLTLKVHILDITAFASLIGGGEEGEVADGQDHRVEIAAENLVRRDKAEQIEELLIDEGAASVTIHLVETLAGDL